MKQLTTLKSLSKSPSFRTSFAYGLRLWLVFSALTLCTVLFISKRTANRENRQRQITAEAILMSLFESQARFGDIVYSRGSVLEKGRALGLKGMTICDGSEEILPTLDNNNCKSMEPGLGHQVQITNKGLMVYFFWQDQEMNLLSVVLNSLILAIFGSGILLMLVSGITYFVTVSSVLKYSKQLSLLAANEDVPSMPNVPELAPLSEAILGLKHKLLVSNEENQKMKIQSSLGEMAKQVAHDIRSPLSALSMIMATLKDLPEEKRVLIRNAVQRINDISNGLLQKGVNAKARVNAENLDKKQAVDVNETSLEFIPVIVDMLVSEKRMQFREYAGVEIEVDLKNSFGAFSKVNSGEFKRVISNLVNNAVEAFDSNQGKVVVGVTLTRSKVEVFVRDNGKGIPEQILKKMGEKGVTHGKEGTSSGSGIGVYHAKKTIESFGGEFNIETIVGTGTTMRLILPMADTPAWFADKIDLSGKATLVSLDDDVSIHQIWEGRLASLGSPQIHHLKIQSGDAFHKYVSENISRLRSTLFLVDFELLNQPMTGLDLIEELGLEKYAILVTSRYEEPEIRERASRIGLKLLPKSLAGFVPIEIELPKSKFDFVLVDDDPLVHMTWEMAAKDQGKTIACFSSGEAIKAVIKGISFESRIFVDSNLARNEKGEDLAKELFDLGYHNLYLATGYEPDQFRHVTWVKGVVGKDLPS